MVTKLLGPEDLELRDSEAAHKIVNNNLVEYYDALGSRASLELDTSAIFWLWDLGLMCAL